MSNFYVVIFERRVMGFASDAASAQRLVDVFAEGNPPGSASFERIEGEYPTNEYEAALAFERSKERRGLRIVRSAVIEDACEELTQVESRDSGFFTAVRA